MATYKPRGYHHLANLMGPYPETAIFRRFGDLNALNLLSVQAELLVLQAEFKGICEFGDMNKEKFSTEFFTLHASADEAAKNDQYVALMKIRKKLWEYNSTLLEVAQISLLPRPSKPNLIFLREWLENEVSQQKDSFLTSSERFTWDARPETEQDLLDNDLVTLQTDPHEEAPFSNWLSTDVLDWYHRVRGYKSQRAHKIIDPESGVVQYSNATLFRVNAIVVTVLSSAIPVLAIVALYFVQQTIQRIGVLVAFTILFAFALAAFTNASRLEIFASTSGFVAIEVVFIGTVLPGQV